MIVFHAMRHYARIDGRRVKLKGQRINGNASNPTMHAIECPPGDAMRRGDESLEHRAARTCIRTCMRRVVRLRDSILLTCETPGKRRVQCGMRGRLHSSRYYGTTPCSRSVRAAVGGTNTQRNPESDGSSHVRSPWKVSLLQRLCCSLVRLRVVTTACHSLASCSSSTRVRCGWHRRA
jgi:hypothetical protein